MQTTNVSPCPVCAVTPEVLVVTQEPLANHFGVVRVTEVTVCDCGVNAEVFNDNDPRRLAR